MKWKSPSFARASSASGWTASDPPSVVELEFLRSTNNNTWGLGISEEGLIFGSTANGNPSVFMPVPNRYYERVARLVGGDAGVDRRHAAVSRR